MIYPEENVEGGFEHVEQCCGVQKVSRQSEIRVTCVYAKKSEEDV